MKQKTEIRYQLALLSYLLCSSIVYNPLYNASRPTVACLLSLGGGIVISAFNFYIFKKTKTFLCNSLPRKFLCIAAFMFLCLGAVFFISTLTDSFAAFSSFYDSKEKHLIFAVLVLFGCAYASCKKSDGIFRLCQLITPLMLFYYLVLFLSPITTKNIIIPQKNMFSGISAESILQAAKSALYLFSDIAVFHFSFNSQNDKSSSDIKFFTKRNTASAFTFSIIMILNRIRTSLTFGETLVQNLSFCDLASIKLLPLFSFPEIYLVIICLACTVKISVYIRAASRILCMMVKTSDSSPIRNDSYICALFCLVLSTLITRLIPSFSSENSLFILFVPLSSLFITLLCLLSSKRQNKS